MLIKNDAARQAVAAVAMAAAMSLGVSAQGTASRPNPPAGQEKRSYYEAVKEAKRRLILQALQESGGSYTEAAKLLGMGVNYLHRLVNGLDLRSTIRKEP